METLSRLPRRLTQLYSDTKISCDAVIEQDSPETIPEVNALHRKYRIQKDRLIAWGLEWSDNTKGPQGDIDESVERAGLTETVTSVLGTIKEILDEAEKMHPPAMLGGGKSLSGEKTGARPSDPPSWAASDRSRYEDLAKELTTSIDTLYGLSRSRRLHRDTSLGPKPSSKTIQEPPKSHTSVFLSPEYNASDITLINPATLPVQANIPNVSFRSTLPPKLEPSDLVLPLEEPPPYETVGPTSSIRVIGKLITKNSSTNPWKTDGSKTIETPVLIEYAAFDSAYHSTGVSPPTDRLEKLLSILVNLTNEQSFHGTLTCLGYFEDPNQPRFGLVFELPSFVYSGPSDSYKSAEELRPVTLLNVLQTGSKSLHNSNSATPPLEDRFRLAFTLALTFGKIHAENFVHKDVNSSNILVFRKSRRHSSHSKALDYALRSPVICSFDLFSEYDVEPAKTMPTLNIYRHPEDPKFTGEKAKDNGLQFDLYGLGLLLLEIGLWLPLSDLFKAKYTLADFKRRLEDVYIRRLASKCGTAYMQAVRDCFEAADAIASGAESLHSGSDLYKMIRMRLQRCCLLDDVDPKAWWGELTPTPGASTPVPAPSPLKRKNGSVAQAADLPQSPSYKNPKRWAMEKGSEILKRTASQSRPSPKSSPNLSQLSRSGSRGSQHSIRKSISHSMHSLLSPKEETAQPMDWRQTHYKDPLEESGYFEAPSTNPTTPPICDDRDACSLSSDKLDDAAATIQRAWRASREDTTPQRSMSLKDYKDKIIVIQKAWRKKKEGRAIQALVHSNLIHWPQATLGFQANLGYPTPEPEPRAITQTDGTITSSIQIQTDIEAPPRPKLRLHAVKFPPHVVNTWHDTMLPRLERLIERALKNSEETISIDLVAIGETQATARPTIFVTCTSTAKVKAVLARRFHYDESVFDLKVRRGKVRRSKMNRTARRHQLPHRSMMNTEPYSADAQVINPFYQQRPLCGASIGAYRDEHLPPVSFGGVVLVDGEPLGMSVHHLLDAPSEDDESEYGDDAGPSPNDAILSSANSTSNPWLMGMGSQPGVQIAPHSPAPMWNLEISDDDLKSDEEMDEDYDFSSDESDSDEESDDELADSVTSHVTAGDIDGIELGKGKCITITQPAIDDVDEDFFPNEEDRDEDHLDSHELGYVHASSGIRRWKREGIVHEIDWALLKLNPERLQPYNLVQGGRRFCISPEMEPEQELIKAKLEEPVCRRYYKPEEDEFPTSVASARDLGGLRVHCFGRTSGLKGGIVGAAMSSVRIYRRKSFSRSWHVIGEFGVGGDSGAWVIQNSSHRVCGHVLAWCERNNLAYICPMEVLLEDIKRSIGAQNVCLPGSVESRAWITSAASRANATAVAANGYLIEDTRIKDRDMRVSEIEVGVEGLGIGVDSAVDMTRTVDLHTHSNNSGPARSSASAPLSTGPTRPRRQQPQLPMLVTSADAEREKENMPVLRSRVMRVKEGRGAQLEIVTSPVEVGGGMGRSAA